MKKKQILGAALALGLTTVAGAEAAQLDAESLFGISETASPSVAMSSDSDKKCGEGSCGGEHKCGEGKCGGDHKCGEGSCGSH